MLPPRIITGSVYLLAWMILCVCGGWPLTLVMTALSWIALGELRWVASRRRVRLAVEVGYPVCLAFIIAAHVFANDPESHGLAVVGLIVLTMLVDFGLHLGAGTRMPTSAVTITLFGCLYCGLLPSMLVLLRNLDPQLTAMVWHWPASLGARLLAFLLAVTMTSDVGGFIAGKTLGRHKLAGTVSPNKTVEGLVGAVVAAVLAALVFGGALSIGAPSLAGGSNDTAALAHRVILGVLLGLAGQLGDFGASIFKREAEVKDYGWLFPGHGGVLDRLDALIINAPILYLYARRIL